MSLTKAEARNVDKLRDAGADDAHLLVLFIMTVRLTRGVNSMPSLVRDVMLDAINDLTEHVEKP